MGAAKHIQETFQKEFKGEKDDLFNYKALQNSRILQEPVLLVIKQKRVLLL